MMKKILTVLIPVYNTEKYIKRCLDSLIDESIIDNIEILIVDAMFTTSDILIKYKDELKELKKIIDIAIDDLEKDEKAYYDLIKDYLYDTSFEEFQQSLSNIKWINKNIDQNILDYLKEHNFPTKELL